MRTLISLISGLITVLTSVLTCAQPYQPIPDDAHWVVSCSTFNPEPWPGSTSISKTHYKINGDTIINGLNYKKIETRLEPSPIWYGGLALRQDVITREVYIYYYITEEEYLFYDFNIEVGEYFVNNNDAVQLGLSSCLENWTDSMRLDSISSWTPNQTQFNFEYVNLGYRNFYFSPALPCSLCPNVVWVEGMGSTFSLDSPFGGYAEFGTSWVSTFCTGDTTWAPFSELECSIITGASSQRSEVNLIFSWSGDGLIIQSQDNQSIGSVLLVNMLGQAVRTKTVTSSGSFMVVKPLGNTQSGIWTVTVEFTNGDINRLKYYIPN